MKKLKIENQKGFEARIEYFRDKYNEGFKDWISPPDCDKNFVRERFKRDVLDLKLNLFYHEKLFAEARDFRNKKQWMKGIKTFEAIKMFCQEENLKGKFQIILQSLAEHDAILNFYDELNSVKNEPLKKTTNNHVQKGYKKFIPKRFDKLFFNPELIKDCLELLRYTEKPCINSANEYLRNKGVFVVWFNTLETKKMFNCKFYKDIDRAETLNENFPGLNIGGSTFRSDNMRAVEKYKTLFESEISALKP